MHFDDGSHFVLNDRKSVVVKTLSTNTPASPNIQNSFTFKKFMEAIKNGNFKNVEGVSSAKTDDCLLLFNFYLMFSVFR